MFFQSIKNRSSVGSQIVLGGGQLWQADLRPVGRPVVSPTRTPITIDGTQIECVNEFTYLGSTISTTLGTHRDIKTLRLAKPKSVFARLRPALKSSSYSKGTKLKLYNSVVKATLMYGSECWRMNECERKSLDTFHTGSLRRIHWPETLSNADLYRMTNSEPLSQCFKNKRLRWLGHVLRMKDTRILKRALQWTPQGRRKVGRPVVTWKSITKELIEMGMTWREARVKAKDRLEWNSKVMTLCSTRSE
ncbi:endonuclease-reverse transcriptase [Brachionus plicatilis]|uniref:Endonuclease-reverse transcriptase n=1 Tax=Brachionus plicatilis TaxID=10195 RepID=A0A3M7P9F9_BRAPC|nr:endonuclease-reverse transcriptase [Brachionus plicatilis]